jgi:hypothetical protein
MNTLELILIVVAIAMTLWANEVARVVDWSCTWFALHRVCGWCGRHLGGNPFAQDTHGICPTCSDALLADDGNIPTDSERPQIKNPAPSAVGLNLR